MKVGFVFIGTSAQARGLAAAMVRSVRAAMPGVEVWQGADAETAPIEGVDGVNRRATLPLAHAVLDHRANAGAGDWLFLDTDVLVQRDVRHVFDAPFDVAVATREGTLLDKEVGTKFMARMPHNMGVAFSRCPDFWAAALERVRGYSESRQAWMGDQLALNETIASGAFQVAVLENAFNYPPKSKGDDVSHKAIVHFKGKRKAWMLERAS